ncbi:ubiquitin-like domain-containing protein [Bacillus manliponensis]|uniref:ubiquitin-like domain-containing protein n=1 Tax=Bacillus manliponensis TaxID=574376 RepID=UPI00351352B1
MIVNAKDLLSKMKVSKKLALQVTSVLIISGSIGTAAYAATTDKVILEIDGKKQEVYTYAGNVKELLQNENIKIGEEDVVAPNLSTKIKGEMKIVVEKAKPFTITIDGEERAVKSTVKTVQNLLTEEGIEVGEHDKVYPSLHEELQKEQDIVIQRAFPVMLHVGGEEEQLWSTSTTVADFLKERQVVIGELDRVEPALHEEIQKDTVVKVVRIEKVIDVVEAAIPFSSVNKEDSSLFVGTKKVTQEGIQGKKKTTFEVVKENGNEVSRTVQKEETLLQPKEQVVSIGTKQAEVATDSGSGSAGVAREFYVEATAYSPYCGGCQGVSAGGYNYKANPNMKLIAVDPRVIPLGTKVWVEGYGYAVAGDTGGAIKGNRIDVLMPSEKQAYAWGRKRVKIQVLQ